jgi:hypothetical protein
VTPYYQHAGVSLYHGDCRELLPSLPADRLITDPVWPNADARLAGADRPRELLAEALALARVAGGLRLVQNCSNLRCWPALVRGGVAGSL